MTPDQVRRAIADALGEIAPEAQLERVAPEAELRHALDLDSVDFLSLLERLAEQTGIEVPESAYAQVATLDGLVGYLVSHPGG
jgi:acyl carrier protein